MRAHNDVARARGSRQPVNAGGGKGGGGKGGGADGGAADDEVVLSVAAEVLGHLADPTRLRLISLLGREAMDVSALTERVPASRSSVSQHLARLRLSGLVRSHRVGRRMVYRVTSAHLVALAEQAFGFAEHLVRAVPEHHRPSIV